MKILFILEDQQQDDDSVSVDVQVMHLAELDSDKTKSLACVLGRRIEKVIDDFMATTEQLVKQDLKTTATPIRH